MQGVSAPPPASSLVFTDAHLLHLTAAHNPSLLAQTLTPEEAKERAARLAKMRNVLFYAEQKAKRWVPHVRVVLCACCGVEGGKLLVQELCWGGGQLCARTDCVQLYEAAENQQRRFSCRLFNV